LRIAEQGAVQAGDEMLVQEMRRAGVRAEDRKVKLVNPGPEHILTKYFLNSYSFGNVRWDYRLGNRPALGFKSQKGVEL